MRVNKLFIVLPRRNVPALTMRSQYYGGSFV